MSLVSILALALLAAIASLVILDGRETSRDHQQVVLATKEPSLPTPRRIHSSLRNRQWCSARIARLRQGPSSKGPESYPGFLLGSVEHTGWAGGMLTLRPRRYGRGEPWLAELA